MTISRIKKVETLALHQEGNRLLASVTTLEGYWDSEKNAWDMEPKRDSQAYDTQHPGALKVIEEAVGEMYAKALAQVTASNAAVDAAKDDAAAAREEAAIALKAKDAAETKEAVTAAELAEKQKALTAAELVADKLSAANETLTKERDDTAATLRSTETKLTEQTAAASYEREVSATLRARLAEKSAEYDSLGAAAASATAETHAEPAKEG